MSNMDIKTEKKIALYKIQNMRSLTKQESMIHRVLKGIFSVFPYHMVTQQVLFSNEESKYYIIDFFFPSLALAIEIDGNQHRTNKLEYDSHRDSLMESLGILVIRFDNLEVENNLREVVFTILRAIKSRLRVKKGKVYWDWMQESRKREQGLRDYCLENDFETLKKLSSCSKHCLTTEEKNNVYDLSHEILDKMLSIN